MKTIEVHELSKRYVLGGRRADSLRDSIAGVFSRNGTGAGRDELWALRDVSFEVGEGETLGIIGHNGAGKSTLLKILSRITKPTSGYARLHGRIGSLLEVGTGFHNELTGRENIYMNGAILGMKRAEIAAKFDEIVAFSEVERFLDTSVKHYSSGMYMRLAFSIAAHLEPEILIVDEVLAVGDAAFQKKCLRKMRETGETGRTVLFVSHDMTSIARLCRRTIWVNEGRIVADGETTDVIGRYVQQLVSAGAEKKWGDPSRAPGDDVVRLRKVRICSESGETLSSADIRRPAVVEITYDVVRDGAVLSPNIQLYDDRGICIFVSIDQEERWHRKARRRARYVSRTTIPGNLLAEGNIAVTVVIATLEPITVHVLERDAVVFTVTDPNTGDTARANYAGHLPGVVRPVLKWETEELAAGAGDPA